MGKLTKEQQIFATEHHNLIYTFLYRKHCNIYEYYDIVAIGYLKAVVNFHNDYKLKCYSFSTIAWRTMEFELVGHFRFMSRKKRNGFNVSLNTVIGENMVLEDIIVSQKETNAINDVVTKIDLQRIINENQWKTMNMRLSGYNYNQTADLLGVTRGVVAYKMYKIRRILENYVKPISS